MSIREEQSQNSLYILLGVFFTGIALVSLVSLIVIRTKAQGNTLTEQLTEISNDAPTVVNTPIISYAQNSLIPVENNQIVLVEGSLTSVYVNGRVSDANSYTDISTVTVALYDSAITTASCTPDNTDACYFKTFNLNELTCGGDLGNTQCSYSAKFELTHHTNPSTFKATVIVTDSQTTSSPPAESDTATVNTLIAINAAASIDYGTLAIGETGQQLLKIDNWGNILADLNVSATALACSIGTIPATLINLNGTSLNTTPTLFPDFNLPKQTGVNIGNSTTNTQILLGPINNVKGTCTGAISLTAINN